MPEPTYRIAQRLHERRAAVGLKTYGRHLDANSQGCMLVHALEEAADQVNYLIAEVQRRREAIAILAQRADSLREVRDYGFADTLTTVIDLLGGESALAQYDEILGTVAENATVAALPKDAGAEAALATVWRKEAEAEICRMYGVDKRKIVAEAIAELSAEQPELREYRFSRYVNGKLKAEGAVVMAENEIVRLNGEAQRFEYERTALAADNARLRSVLVWLDRIGGLGLQVHARITEALAATPAQSLAAHDAALLRAIAEKWYREGNPIQENAAVFLQDEADRIAKEPPHA